jgi:acyl phosphate:glycerol-3-phosphate acyltransferase
VGAAGAAMSTILAAVVGYVLGSIPFGLLLTRIAGHRDIREIGSGSIGATNVLRTGSKRLAALTLIFDVLKGSAAVLVGATWSEEAALAGGAAVIVGHIFPVWLGFRGGKGVATAFGVLIVIAWPVALGAALLWLATALVFRFSSLAALVAAVAAAAAAGFAVDRPRGALIALIAILVVLRHRENVQRLLAGTESRISFGKG